MKKLFFPAILLMAITLCCCTEKPSLDGNWVTTSLSQDGKQLEVLESNMNIIPQENNYKVKGNAGMNLYYADIEIKNKNISVYNMMNTGFQGTADEMEYENNFFAVLMFAETFTITDDILTINAPEKGMQIQLKKKQ